jgi:hypothetical protein
MKPSEDLTRAILAIAAEFLFVLIACCASIAFILENFENVSIW